MEHCETLKNCSVEHCTASRAIRHHWFSCTKSDFPVSLPLKEEEDSSEPNQQQRQHTGETSVPNAAVETDSRNIQEYFDTVGSNNTGALESLTTNLSNLQMQPSNVSGTNDWPITNDLRNRSVHMFLQAICPKDLAYMQNERIHHWAAYVKRVERDMYEKANSQTEYYHLLEIKILQIKNGVGKRSQLRKEQQMQQAPIEENQVGAASTTAITSRPSSPLKSNEPLIVDIKQSSSDQIHQRIPMTMQQKVESVN